MLDKAFLRRFFDQLEALNDADLQAKIGQVEAAAKSFTKGSEAAADARFMLRHLRRELLERQFKPPAAS